MKITAIRIIPARCGADGVKRVLELVYPINQSREVDAMHKLVAKHGGSIGNTYPTDELGIKLTSKKQHFTAVTVDLLFPSIDQMMAFMGELFSPPMVVAVDSPLDIAKAALTAATHALKQAHQKTNDAFAKLLEEQKARDLAQEAFFKAAKNYWEHADPVEPISCGIAFTTTPIGHRCEDRHEMGERRMKKVWVVQVSYFGSDGVYDEPATLMSVSSYVFTTKAAADKFKNGQEWSQWRVPDGPEETEVRS